MQGKLSPSALSVPDAVKVLQAAGSRFVTEDIVRADIRSGAPANPDGTINLVHYAAWLVARLANPHGQEEASRGDD